MKEKETKKSTQKQKNQEKIKKVEKDSKKTSKNAEKTVKKAKNTETINEKAKKTKTTNKNLENKNKPKKSNKKETSKVTDTKEKTQKANEKYLNIKILGYHDLPLNCYVFDKVKNPKAVVLIVHGMQEHCLRYQNFAEHLNKNGYVVVMSDLRGHGLTAISKDKLGHGEKDIFKETLQDQKNIIAYIKKQYDLPLYVFAHSYGSLLSQNLIQQCPEIEKCVLCGTTNGSSLTIKMGSSVVTMLSPFKSEKSKGGLVEKLCISSYGKKFKDGNWLTRDLEQYEKYKKDEYCGGSFPFSFYKSMIKNTRKSNKNIDKIGNKKIFLIAGDKDPVGEFGKQVKNLYNIYKKHNIDAKIKLYSGARHELINETNRDEVYADVVDFFNS